MRGDVIPDMRKLLLVEDDAFTARVLALTLSRFGYDTLTASGGEQAVDLVRSDGTIDLILMDIDLGGGIDGTEAARRILAIRKLPIVFLTSHSEREMVEKVKGITRYGYVIKNAGDFVLQSSIEMAFELFDTHEKLRREESRLRTLVQTIPDLVWLKDRYGVYLQCNGMFERFFGAKEADIVGKTDFDFVDGELAQFFREHDRLAMEAGKPTRNEEWLTFASDGRRGLFETIKTPLKDEKGDLVGILGIARDITERKQAEESLHQSREALQESEERVKAKLETILSPEGEIASLDLEDIIDAKRLQRLMDDFFLLTNMGIGIIDIRGKILVATGWQDICTRFHRVNPETCEYCRESDFELTQGIEPGTFKEYRCKNNLWDIATPIYIGGKHLGNIFLGQFFYTDDEIDYEAFRAQARKFGFDEADYIAALDRAPRWTRERVSATMRFYTDLAGLVSNLSYGNIKLARALEEKELLLKELKHRVKNSLAIVSSLISMNMDRIADERDSRIFLEAVGRINSISAIYEQLNSTGSLDRIDLDAYVRDLVGMLAETYTVDPEKIRFTRNIESMDLPLKVAAPLGLILNELITNAIKYAYPGNADGEVRISVERSGDSAILRVADDGPGLPQDFDPERADSLGLRIAFMLAEQIGGRLIFEEGGGTNAAVTFKA
ncbi:MAG TPA: hypothetical protein DIC34_11275 [Treponema sp.]|nr:hypothetical protein [Treponema sp.]